jgi:quercetin dioxygenase-like cupin family protein
MPTGRIQEKISFFTSPLRRRRGHLETQSKVRLTVIQPGRLGQTPHFGEADMKTGARQFCVMLGATAYALAPASVAATPGSGFVPSPVVSGHFGSLDVKTESDKVGKWAMILKTKDDSDVGTTRLTVQPGGFSGWHSHPNPIFVTVTHGSIVWYDGSDPACPGHTYSAGDSFIEQAFRIHNVKNPSASTTAEFIAIGVSPTGVPGRNDEVQPTNCNF